MSERPSTRAVFRQSNSPHFAAGDIQIRQTVMLREFLIQEGVVAIEQFQHRTIFANDVTKTAFGFFTHRATEVAVEFGGRRVLEAPAPFDHLLKLGFLFWCAFLLRNVAQFLEALASPG